MKKLLFAIVSIVAYEVNAFAPPSSFLPHRLALGMAKTGADELLDDKKYCLPLEKVCLEDLPKVGGKTASLGEMIQQLSKLVRNRSTLDRSM